jgi:hypothetical protein
VLNRPVGGFERQPVGTGQMADSVRYSLDDGTTVVIKFASNDDTSRATGTTLRSYEIEVRFYQQVAATVGIRTPHCLYAAVEPESGWFTLVLEDMAPAVQGDQMAGCSVDDAALALQELVKLHAPRWGDQSLMQLEWLHRHEQAAGTGALVQMLMPGFVERYEDRMAPEHMALSRRLMESLPHLMAQRTGPLTVTHGDYRLDNMLFGTTGSAATLAVVDWQTCTTGPALTDASYFIGAGLHTEDRRKHEEDLMREYHHGLVASGVELDWDTCWNDYRRYSFGGLVMAIAASMLVVRTDRGDDMFMTMASRHSTQALDLDATEFLLPA